MISPVICPHCLESSEEELSKDKQTLVCRPCNKPYELYPDGRTEVSALYEVVGEHYYRTKVFYGWCQPPFYTRADNDFNLDDMLEDH